MPSQTNCPNVAITRLLGFTLEPLAFETTPNLVSPMQPAMKDRQCTEDIQLLVSANYPST